MAAGEIISCNHTSLFYLVGRIHGSIGGSFSFEVAREVILIIVNFHPHRSAGVDAMQYHWQACAKAPISSRVGDVYIPAKVIVYVVIPVIDISGMRVIVPCNNPLSVMVFYYRMNYTHAIMTVRLVMMNLLVVMTFFKTVVPIIIILMSPSLCIGATCQGDDQHCDHDRKKLRCCFHITWG